MSTLYSALVNGLIIAGFTGLGSMVAFAGFKLPRWGLDFSMSFAAGVMLVACFTSLIIPGFERGFYFDVGVGIAVGVIVMVSMDLVIPHEHLATGYEGPEYMRRKLRKAILLALAVAIHNVPEGLAVGVSTVYSERLGFATALAIGLQDVPEGAAVALPLAILWSSRLKGFITGVLSGWVETVMALIGALVFTVAGGLLGLGMGFSAGAMMYIVVEEILPEVLHESSTYRKISAAGFFLGFYVMLYLDLLLG
jgi:ZIP family zinc transporter